MRCVTCGEPLKLTDCGLIGIGGVCRDPWNPNQDDEGLHLVEPYDGGTPEEVATSDPTRR